MLKKLAFSLIVLTFVLPLRADEMLQNGDFSDGINHWRGDGCAPGNSANDDPMQASVSSTAKGIIIPLKQTQWTKIQQDIHPKAGPATVTITFRFSQGLTFSTKANDYKGIPAHLGWGWKPYKGPVGAWMVDLTNEEGIKGTHGFVKAKAASNAPQTYHATLRNLDPDGETLTLAFPPGDGQVLVLSASITQ